ncbi:DEAD/DEAH box helicase [Sutcliffiella horikoshii]|uniref:DEAD/DEAH box helicase n=1 Tax=Sutcliffiella horikoshii TaxID=79883 RepID=A0AA95B6Q4_9BACI|nr:DEAD/DEAH box helicase [Sutcliffiella horikoshii]TYS59987.1 DEAD/DEAH box helicase [Sutcliffiella horikoshii]
MLFTRTINNLLKITNQKSEHTLRISDISNIQQPPIQSTFPFDHDLQHFLSGKRLLADELLFNQDTLQTHYQNGYLKLDYGVHSTNAGNTCNRCGSTDQNMFASFPCARCHQTCTYCRNCIMMGRVSECTPLISWSGPLPLTIKQSENLSWDGTLSKGQQLASDKVVEAIHNKTSLLVWAVCGAGKTEVLFKGIETALSKGGRFCIATPRTDVVLELSPRLKEVFPEIEVATLYGGSEDRTKNAPLTIATTHQLLRYYRAFDTLIIDEVDAFPYNIDPTLEYAANQGRMEDGSLIYLSATPSKKMQRDVRAKKIESVVIPARYHKQPLPVPTLEWCGKWEKRIKKGELPANVRKWVRKHMKNGSPIFLFVPNIAVLEKVVEILAKEHSELVAGVHAKDKERKEKVDNFRKGNMKILVTTTILERGVTVADVQVGVLGAEDDVFTESALVQIAGRVGRSSRYPTGDVRFFHYGKTNEMVGAVDQIRRMNYQARKGGFFQ